MYDDYQLLKRLSQTNLPKIQEMQSPHKQESMELKIVKVFAFDNQLLKRK